MFRELVTIALIIFTLLMSVRLVFTIGLNYPASILAFNLLFIIYISPTNLFIFGK